MVITADTEKAFPMIEISPSDQDMLHFLWMEDHKDISSKYSICDLQVLYLDFVHLQPFRLSYISSLKYQSKYPEVILAIKDALYVDDMISGGGRVDEAFKLYDVARQVMHEGGFNLRKWNSNSCELLSRIASTFGQPVSDTDMCTVHGEGNLSSLLIVGPIGLRADQFKLLGIVWKSESHNFTFCFSEIVPLVTKLPATRRSLLRVISSIFDPCIF